MYNLIEKILEIGIENCLFLVPMRPINNYFGIGIRSSNDPEVVVPMRIIEKRYKISENYKIELISDYEVFGKKSFYVSDLKGMTKDGRIEFFSKSSTPKPQY